MRASSRLWVLGWIVVLFVGFQNCSRLQAPSFGGSATSPSVSSEILNIVNSSTNPADVAEYYQKAVLQPGNGHSDIFKGQTGLYFWGSNALNASFTAGQPLAKPVKKIQDSGFKALRLAFGTAADGYNIPFATGAAPTSLSAWLQVGEMRQTLLNPAFPLIALTATDYTSQGAVTNVAQLKRESFRNALFEEYLQFYLELFQLPVTTPKVFVISNWEGDNQIFWSCRGIDQGLMTVNKNDWIEKCATATFNQSGQTLNDTIDGFIIWSVIRKAALLAAREQAAPHPNVDIRFAIEFNSVNMVPRNLSRSVLWDVIPIVKPDIALYSSYESVNNKSLTKDIQAIRAHLNLERLDDTLIAIGEIGRTGSISDQQKELHDSLSTVGLNDVAFSFVWNAFNETVTDDKTSMSMGLWMPDGKLHVAPTEGRLVPDLNPVPDVSSTCFSVFSPNCEFTVSGRFPTYALNTQSAEVRCEGINGVVPLQARYVTTTFAAVSLPATLKGQNCRLRVRSDIGLASEWSNPFKVGTAYTASAGAGISGPGYDIIVVAGQSNSSNSGLGPRTDLLAGLNDGLIDQQKLKNCRDIDAKADGIFDVGEADGVVNAADFVYDCQLDNPNFANDIRPFHRLGFAVSFARQYAKNSLAAGRKVLLVAGGVTGTGSPQWAAGSARLENVLDRTSAALQLPDGNNRVVAFLWSQGEADIMSVGRDIQDSTIQFTRTDSDTYLTDYAVNLSEIINRVRTRIGNPHLPFLVSEKAPQWTDYQVDKLRYQDMDRWVTQNIGNAFMVPADNLPSNPVCGSGASFCENAAFVHFSAQSNVDLGIRFYGSYRVLRP